MARFLRALDAIVLASAIVGLGCGRPVGGSPGNTGAAGEGGGVSGNDADGGAPLADAGGPPPVNDGGVAPPDTGQPDIPPDVPALALLTPQDVPARPAVDPSCPVSLPLATVHFPGPCTILEARSNDTYRTTRRWKAAIRVGQTSEYWSPDFPSGISGYFDRSKIDWTLTDDGRPSRAVAIDQSVYGDTAGGRYAYAGFTNFDYDAAGKLVGSTNSYWARNGVGGSFASLVYQDTYAGDALGRIFLADRKEHGWAPITIPLDNVFLFTPVPVTNLSYGQSFTQYPDGVVSSYTVTVESSSFRSATVQSFDEQGILVQRESVYTGRFGDTTTTTWTYHYDRGRLVSVDATATPNPSGASPLHTEYRYDAKGNNIERVSSDSTRYVAVYDRANNLVCELTTGGPWPSDVRHYDYSCFAGR
jgi:hypothetical protein